MPRTPSTDSSDQVTSNPGPDVRTTSRRGLLAAGAALGAAAVWAPSAARQDATPVATPVASPAAFPAASPVASPVADAGPPPKIPGAAGGGIPRVVDVDIDGLAGAGAPAPEGLELVAALEGPLLVGVTVSGEGRVFLNWPRWADPVAFTVGELVDGQVVAFPDAEINRFDPRLPGETLVSVQAMTVDARDNLWLLDTGSINFQPVIPGAPKLVRIDLAANRIVETILFPPDVVLRSSSINDLRFDLARGTAGVAYITDASPLGTNAIITVDLGSGRSWRRLAEHPSTVAEEGFVPIVEGEELYQDLPGMPRRPITIGADGLAIAADGSRLFYCPLASRRLYAVETAPLAEEAPDAEAVATVEDLGDKGSAADGLESDTEGRVYLTQYERNAIARRLPDGTIEDVVADPRILWPDTLSLAADGYLYFTANQLHRQPSYHDGVDLRRLPYAVFRFPVDATPIRLA